MQTLLDFDVHAAVRPSHLLAVCPVIRVCHPLEGHTPSLPCPSALIHPHSHHSMWWRLTCARLGEAPLQTWSWTILYDSWKVRSHLVHMSPCSSWPSAEGLVQTQPSYFFSLEAFGVCRPAQHFLTDPFPLCAWGRADLHLNHFTISYQLTVLWLYIVCSQVSDPLLETKWNC